MSLFFDFQVTRVINVVNKPWVSRFIAGVYIGLVAFIATCTVFFVYAGFFTPLGITGLIAAAVTTVVGIIMLFILASIHRTRYILSNDELIIRATRLIGGNKRIHLRDVEHVEKSLIPLGLRLFGASFHGGYYQIPGFGRAFMVITNFNDGVLIKTKYGNYIITPEKPESFVKAINDARTSLLSSQAG
jgi:membrane protein YdbS with pleckstrin-like domain